MSSSHKLRRWLLPVIVLLYFLAFDWWAWERTGLIWGLPVFLVYLIGIQLLLAVAFALFVTRAWPEEDEPPASADEGRHS